MKSDDFVIYCLAWHKKRHCCRLLIAYLMETSLHHLMQVAILSVYTGAQSPRVECRVRREAGGKCITGLGRRGGMNRVDKFLFFFPKKYNQGWFACGTCFGQYFLEHFLLFLNSSQGLAIGLGLVHIQKRFPNLFTYVECYEVHVSLCILLNKNNFLKAKLVLTKFIYRVMHTSIEFKLKISQISD